MQSTQHTKQTLNVQSTQNRKQNQMRNNQTTIPTNTLYKRQTQSNKTNKQKQITATITTYKKPTLESNTIIINQQHQAL